MDAQLIIGALIGAIITLVVSEGYRVPRDVRMHDQRIRTLDDNLGTWVQDDDRELRKQLIRIINDPKFDDREGLRNFAKKEARDHVARRYRDRMTVAEQERGAISASEGLLDQAWRFVRRRPLRGFRAPDENAATIAGWSKGVDPYTRRRRQKGKRQVGPPQGFSPTAPFQPSG